MAWPLDYPTEIRRRFTNLQMLNDDAVLRAKVQRHYANGAQGCIDWINDWAVTYDPRNNHPVPRVLPLILFPRQIDFVNFIVGCMHDKENGLVEKCRDMGASWVCCAISAWLWIYHPAVAVGWGSRTVDYVDIKGDLKAILPKIRLILENLPSWMLPIGFTPRLHMGYLKLINPENMSSVTGEGGDNMGRGGRTTLYFKDESAHYEHPESVESAIGDNTNVAIDISSVNGTGNVFHRKRMAGEEWEPGKIIASGITRVFIFDWRHHPAKTDEWYEKRRARAEREGMMHILAQEVDRDYSAAIVGVIIPQIWVKAAIDAHKKLGIPVAGKVRAMQDVADGGIDKNALLIRKGIVCTFAKAWAGEAGDAAAVSVPICNEHGVTNLNYDSIGVGAGFKTAVNVMKKDKERWNPKLRVSAWNAGAEPMHPDRPSIPGDPQSPTNEDQYKNLKAQSWLLARARFWKTYQAVVHNKVYPPDELVSIDSGCEHLHQLTMELSQAVIKDTGGVGKTVVDKNPPGTASPNLADGFIALYNPVEIISMFSVS